MYQFSLAAFLTLYQRALKSDSIGAYTTDMRITLLESTLQTLGYSYVARALFKADRLIFAMHLTYGLNSEQFFPNEWEFFLGQLAGDLNASVGDGPLSPGRRRSSFSVGDDAFVPPSWVPNDCATELGSFLALFPDLVSILNLRNLDIWQPWIASEYPERSFSPAVQSTTRPFQKLLLVQILRPDRLRSAMAAFVEDLLHLTDLGGESVNFKRLLDTEILATEPVLIIISAGTDPSLDIASLALNVVGASRYHQIAMGQGQAEVALQKIQMCSKEGHWLCLQNLHLMLAWLPALEKELNSLTPHPNFRLWLTSEAHLKFPAMLLKSSLKITYEAPPGLKRNMQRIYEGWTPEIISRGGSLGAQTLFVLAWFHAVIQERRTYIPQGWTKFYEFSSADLRASAEIIVRVCGEATESRGGVTWQDIHGLLLYAIYGGRVDDVTDFRLLEVLLLKCFNANVVLDTRKASSRTCLYPGLTFPTSTHIPDYLNTVNSLSDKDTPDMFGLPMNIDRSIERVEGLHIISQLKTFLRLEALTTKFDRELVASEMQVILALWKKLCKGGDMLAMPDPSLRPEIMDPLQVFTYYERTNAVLLARNIDRQLDEITRFSKGTLPLTPDLQLLMRDLFNRSTPSLWLKIWDGPADPLKWLRAMSRRALGLISWLEKSQQGTLLSTAVDLSELFRPDVFLNALRQQSARVTKCPIDTLVFYSAWHKTGTAINLSCTLGGLFLQGCTFDGTRLSETGRNSSSIASIPPCHVAWVSPETFRSVNKLLTFSVPLYSTEEREKTVSQLHFPCVKGEEGKWIQMGTAVFLRE